MLNLQYYTTDKYFYRDKDIRDAWVSDGDSDFPLLRFHSLDKMDWLDAWGTTRRGGVSEGCFSSLNLGFSTGDDPNLIRENIKRLERRLAIEPCRLVRSHQMHGTRLLKLIGPGLEENRETDNSGKPRTNNLENRETNALGDSAENHPGSPDLTVFQDLVQVYTGYDGLYTDQPGLALAISSADCVPILLADPGSRQIAAVHSGWKGTVGRIGAKMVGAMEVQGAKPEDIVAVIGPSISGSHYEVTEELIREFSRVFSPEEMETIAVQTDEFHYLLDLWAACWFSLRQAGLKEENIHFSGLCTYENWQELFSHRRRGGRRGVMNCLIRIRES